MVFDAHDRISVPGAIEMQVEHEHGGRVRVRLALYVDCISLQSADAVHTRWILGGNSGHELTRLAQRLQLVLSDSRGKRADFRSKRTRTSPLNLNLAGSGGL